MEYVNEVVQCFASEVNVHIQRMRCSTLDSGDGSNNRTYSSSRENRKQPTVGMPSQKL